MYVVLVSVYDMLLTMYGHGRLLLKLKNREIVQQGWSLDNNIKLYKQLNAEYPLQYNRIQKLCVLCLFTIRNVYPDNKVFR